MTEPILIGVHGLSNKPPKEQLKDCWCNAINDGLKKIDGKPMPENRFAMAYWADLMNPTPDPNPEPYTDPATDDPKGDPEQYAMFLREKFTDFAGSLITVMDCATDFGKIEEWKDRHLNDIREVKYKDLGFYYDKNSTIRFGHLTGQKTAFALRDNLKKLISENAENRICVLAHSMGSILAYDALRDLERESPALEIELFITAGSPLALEVIKGEIRAERDEKIPSVPKNIRIGWANFSDYRDMICIDPTIVKEFRNETGIEINDIQVSNGYRYRVYNTKKSCEEWKYNYHKSYGYLRTRPMAELISKFLSGG